MFVWELNITLVWRKRNMPGNRDEKGVDLDTSYTKQLFDYAIEYRCSQVRYLFCYRDFFNFVSLPYKSLIASDIFKCHSKLQSACLTAMLSSISAHDWS